MNRPDILEAARVCVMQDRQADYDTPERNFARIAALWSAQKDVPFEAHEVAVFLALVKVARISTSPAKADNWIDLAGYAACGGEIATEQP